MCIRDRFLFCFHLILEIFLGCRQHQFDPVELVDFAGSGIIVYGNDIGLRMLPAQFFNDTLSDNMVGQTAEGLRADNIGGARMDQLQHFAGQEPAFAGLISQ